MWSLAFSFSHTMNVTGWHRCIYVETRTFFCLPMFFWWHMSEEKKTDEVMNAIWTWTLNRCQCELAIMKNALQRDNSGLISIDLIGSFIVSRSRRSIQFSPFFDRFGWENATIFTWSERRPAVGVWSLGSDSGMSPSGSFEWMPGHPTHRPLPLITTGHTAVTNPPALH